MQNAIRVTQEGIFVPQQLLAAFGEFEVVVTDEAITIKPKRRVPRKVQAVHHRRYSFVGIGRVRQSDVSIRVEEILEQEIDQRSGWSLG